MKKTTKFLVIILTILLAFSISACKDRTYDDNKGVKNLTLYIVDGDNNEIAKYEREVELNTLADLFLYLTEEEDSTFGYTSNTSSIGQFITSITVATDYETWQSTGLFPDASKNEFCTFYHTLDDPKQIDYTVEAKVYDKKEFGLAANSTDKTPLIDGASYLFTIAYF